MSKAVWKGGTLMAPVPVMLATCGTVERPNAITVGWTGIVNSDPPMAYLSVRKSRYSHGLIVENGLFALNLTTERLAKATDYCGVRSGRDGDKLAACGLTVSKGKLGCPILDQSPLSLECRVTQRMELGSHDLFLGVIEAVHVEEALIDEGGRLQLERAGLIAYSHGQYMTLGRSLGGFGFSVRKKPERRQQGQKKPGRRAAQSAGKPASATPRGSAPRPHSGKGFGGKSPSGKRGR